MVEATRWCEHGEGVVVVRIPVVTMLGGDEEGDVFVKEGELLFSG